MGRDLLSRILYGAIYTLGLGITVVTSGAGMGILLGLISGYFGGIIDRFILTLSNILIAGEKNSINIVATDLEIGVKEIAEAEKVEQGEICIPARKLYDIVRELPEERLEIQSGENFWVSINAGKTAFNLPGRDPKEFPTFPLIEDSAYFSIGASDLLEMIEKTIFAASRRISV